MQPCLEPTTEQRRKLLEAIRGGAWYLDMAGIYAGIPDTVKLEIALQDVERWKQRERETGEVEDRPPMWLFELSEAINQARGESVVEAIKSVMEQGKSNADHLWRWLESVQPHHWAKIDRHELSGPKGGPIPLKTDTIARINEYAAAFAHLPTSDPADKPESPGAGGHPGDGPGQPVDAVEAVPPAGAVPGA